MKTTIRLNWPPLPQQQWRIVGNQIFGPEFKWPNPADRIPRVNAKVVAVIPDAQNMAFSYYPFELAEVHRKAICALPQLLAAVIEAQEKLREVTQCCAEALSDQWDRSDDGFKAMNERCEEALSTIAKALESAGVK